MVIPEKLKAGDDVMILSTARKVSLEELEEPKKRLESWGLKVHYAPDLFESHNQFAGSDQQRASDLQVAIDSKSIKAIFCARGGYGTTRMIDLVNFDSLQKNPKWLVGFSDVTALHGELNNKRVASIHATMPLFYQKDDQVSLDSLKQVLYHASFHYEFRNHELNRKGTCQGELIGGNLSIINHLIGTSSEFDMTGKILFLEDLDEYLYHIDRMMIQLKRGGKLKNLRGLVIGHMSHMHDNKIPFGKTALEIIKEAVADYPFPVAFNAPIGHETDNRAVIVGSQVALMVNDSQTKLHSIE